MPPRKNKKKVSVASKSTSEQVVSGKKLLKNGKKVGVVADSTLEEVVSDTKVVEDEKGGDTKESVPTPVVKKPCTWLKLDRLGPQFKSSVENSKQGKEAKFNGQVQATKDNKRKRKEKGEERANNGPNIKENHVDSCLGKKEKGIVNDRQEDRKNTDEEAEKVLGGLIFMCNARTKPDCFSYQLMGVPANKKEVVMSIKPGLKLFLYDYDLKLLYGVYEASSAGGMKLEPTAFGGGFPAQVRFIVHKDCLPLPENMFKKALKDSYDERTRKFKTELTVKQVKHLIDLFTPTPWLHPNSQSMVREGNQNMFPVPTPTPFGEESLKRQSYINRHGITDTRGNATPLDHEKQLHGYHAFHNPAPPQDPLFLTEQEYRNNGLRQGSHFLPTKAGDDVSQTREPHKLDQELKQFIRNPASTSIDSADPFFLGEKEYRLYGLRAPHQQIPAAASPVMATNNVVRDSGKNTYDPYDESTTSLVNRYLAMPRAAAVPVEPYHLNHTSDVNTYPRMVPDNGDRGFASCNLREQSVFDQRPYSLNPSRESLELNQGFCLQPETDPTSAPVSRRYSFAGPSPSQYR